MSSVRDWSESEEFKAICDRDSQCLTYSDGSMCTSEPGDSVAEDRRKLLRYIEQLLDNLTV